MAPSPPSPVGKGAGGLGQLFAGWGGTHALDLTGMSLLLQTSLATARAWACGDAGRKHTLPLLQSLCHTLEGSLDIRGARAPLGGRHHQASRAMGQPHAGLHLVAM